LTPIRDKDHNLYPGV
jgi:acyl-CoA oxidase